jgi:hypothetical protein
MTDSTGQHSGLFLSPSLPLSLAEFQRVLSNYVATFELQLRSLRNLDRRLQSEQALGRAHCRQISTLLDANSQALESFSGLLERYENLPDEVVSRRYLPLMFLQNATLQTQRLLQLLGRLQESGRQGGTRKRQQLQQQELLAEWERLLHQYEELLFHARALSDQTRFLLRRRLSQERQRQGPPAPEQTATHEAPASTTWDEPFSREPASD